MIPPLVTGSQGAHCAAFAQAPSRMNSQHLIDHLVRSGLSFDDPPRLEGTSLLARCPHGATTTVAGLNGQRLDVSVRSIRSPEVALLNHLGRYLLPRTCPATFKRLPPLPVALAPGPAFFDPVQLIAQWTGVEAGPADGSGLMYGMRKQNELPSSEVLLSRCPSSSRERPFTNS